MSEERGDLDPAQQVLNELRARLRATPADELVELCAQLVSTYVIEGVLPLSRAAEGADIAADAAGEESFAQLLKRLKAAKKDPVLERFFIDGENISVRIDGQGVLPVTEYRRPLTPPPAGPGVSVQELARREGAPGAAGSIYNRALYQPGEPQPSRGAPAAARQPQRPAPLTPQQPQQPAQPQQGAVKKEEPKSDRFSLIELE